MVGSGRDALRLLYRHGCKELGWRRTYVPSYFCQEVISAIADEGLAVEVYFDDPRESIHAPRVKRDEVVLIVNTFGLRPKWTRNDDNPSVVIEDHTHDPWSTWAKESHADYCIASLRKTLPIPDGGMLWSPKGLALPSVPELTYLHELAAARKLEAMIIKSMFLGGYTADKTMFRSSAISGEAGISTKELSSITPVSLAVLECINLELWRERRLANFRMFADKLAEHSQIAVMLPKSPGSCPFSVVVICRDFLTRERLRYGLMQRRIFPAVLWPLEQSVLEIPGDSVELSRRLMSIHCDGRYGEKDVFFVIHAIDEVLS